jgi:peptidoglycan/LPS O-acetylase OafA/YrhL
MKFPGLGKILLFAVLIGITQFIIRIWLPVGWSMPFTNFQFPFFMQYIALFVFGIIAYQNNWLESVSFTSGKKMFVLAQALIFIGFPLLFILGGAAESGTEKFMGGFTWQNGTYAIWEQLVGLSLIIGLLGIFKNQFNKQGKIAKQLSESAYGVFIIHTPVMLGISALFLHWEIPQLLKFVALAPLTLLACFAIALLLKRTPVVKNIL